MFIILSVFLIAVDFLTKHLATAFLKPLSNIDLIPNVLSLTYVQNRGAAFGIMQNARWFFIIITVVVLIAMVVFIIKKRPLKPLLKWSFAFIFAGAIGNLTERVVNGFVVDMIRVHFFDFPVFNFADCLIVLGTFLLCIYILKSE